MAKVTKVTGVSIPGMILGGFAGRKNWLETIHRSSAKLNLSQWEWLSIQPWPIEIDGEQLGLPLLKMVDFPLEMSGGWQEKVHEG